MLKRTSLLSLLLLSLLAACDKQEPSAPSQSAAPVSAPAGVPLAVASAMPETGGVKLAQSNDKGKKVYDTACITCHATGVAGAPKLGDKALWAPRIAQGMDTLYMHSIKGFQGKVGVMPPKGGFMNLSDADVKAAVDYMVSLAK